MAITNHERVGKALDYLKIGLGPFVERELKAAIAGGFSPHDIRSFLDDPNLASRPLPEWDVSPLLKLMWETWKEIFRNTLGNAERNLISEMRNYRNKWAHQETFSSDDADRALDSAERLLTAVSAPQAEEVRKMKMELRRVIFEEQGRGERRKGAGTVIETSAASGLKAWREVISPHPDVAKGDYQQAEFAADLWQVHLGEGSDEYRKPVDFFRRTFLTESLTRLLRGAALRLAAKGGDPVVQLQTNFGGGKTHSMLALYHMFSGTPPTELLGIDAVLEDAGIKKLPKVNRVVLVGNKISPGSPAKKPDGTVVRTLWGELAWQLGGKQAFRRIAAADETATNPGDALRELLNEYSPCLILIDEWVAYARQLHDDVALPAGSFETQFTFAQTLTESAKGAKACLLVVSLPASDSGISPHATADDVEVGGQRGRAALNRLANVIGRVESSWRPATAEESFEIVRRRLFEPLVEKDQFVQRDVVARAFADLYRTQQAEFPHECRNADYERRLRAAYPIHPEIFDRLYNDWSTLVKFQRTRGVLRLMAAVIHSLWQKGDRNPLILPSMIPIDDPRVQSELTRYLSDHWAPVIEADVDGVNSLPMRLDGEIANLGKLQACRRVARTIYLGSAPLQQAAHRGIEDRRIKLGCVMPGESTAVFGDALRRLASAATYLYLDGARYWYSTQPTVTKLADDRAEQFRRNPDAVHAELERRLREDLRNTGDFDRVHVLPRSPHDVPDDLDTRLVVLDLEYVYSKETASPAEKRAQELHESRGSAPRLFRNSVVFLAADQTRRQDLDEAVRKFLAWESIVAEREALNLDPHQVKQAETQQKSADGAVNARLPETYQWLLAPVQNGPKEPVKWDAMRLTGQESLAVRASRKLRAVDLLFVSMSGTRLLMELNRVPLWRGDAVSVRQLAEDFGKYVYLPRLKDSHVLAGAVVDGVQLLTWERDSFAFADSYDEDAQRYRGLRGGVIVPVSGNSLDGVLVKSDVAAQQTADEQKPEQLPDQPTPSGQPTEGEPAPGIARSAPVLPRRYHGTATLDPARVGLAASKVADEVIAHLVGLVGARVTVTLEIEANVPAGVPEKVVRIVTENGRTLKFDSQGFEPD